MKHGDGKPVNARNARNSWTRRSRLGLAGSLAGWIGVAAGLLLGHGEAPAQVISRVSAPGKFYVDDKASIGLLFNYAAYLISNNTAATFPSVYVAITNIGSSNLIQIGASDTGVRALGALAPGQAARGERLDDSADPVLELDLILAAAPVPRLQLEVAAHDEVLPRLEADQPLQLPADVVVGRTAHAPP